MKPDFAACSSELHRLWCGECDGEYVWPSCPCGALHADPLGRIVLSVTREVGDYRPFGARWETA